MRCRELAHEALMGSRGDEFPFALAAVGVSAGGVSQHLAILRDAGLVNGHRTGRVVLYLRSPAAEDLLTAASRPGPTPQRA